MAVEVGKYLDWIPEDMVQNLRFRAWLLKECARSSAMRATVTAMCAEDPVFMYGAFGWVLDPKNAVSKEIPAILMPFQVELMKAIYGSIFDQHDLRIPKSREMSASWCVILSYFHCWRFIDGQNFLMGSRNEAYVDCPGNYKALFQKMDFMHERLPGFIRTPYHRTAMRLQNMVNGSVINGESTTKDFARGDRRTSLFMDELAAGEPKEMRAALGSTSLVSQSRIFASTLSATDSAFDTVMALPDCREFRLHWTAWPAKRAGLYVGDRKSHKVEVLDPEYEYPEGYRFVCDGKQRSPYYDWEERRIGSNHMTAVELDIDKSSGNYAFFPPDLIHELCGEMGRQPMVVGELEFRKEESADGRIRLTIEGFVPKMNGRLKLWAMPDQTGWLPQDRRYGIGADIAAGTGASNTCISCGDCRTGEKVAAFVSPSTLPHEAGIYCAALAKWLNNAHAMWEAPGPGREFGAMVLRCGHANIYYRKNEAAVNSIPGRHRNPVPGWYPSNPDDVHELYSAYRTALVERRFLNRDVDALRECAQIIRHQSGRVAHAGAMNSTDPSGAKANHGDRPTADALCFRAMGGVAARGAAPDVAPVGSMMWRRQQAAAAAREPERWAR